jgi:hypothetical protein
LKVDIPFQWAVVEVNGSYCSRTQLLASVAQLEAID